MSDIAQLLGNSNYSGYYSDSNESGKQREKPLSRNRPVDDPDISLSSHKL
jgi:hypothetical protein